MPSPHDVRPGRRVHGSRHRPDPEATIPAPVPTPPHLTDSSAPSRQRRTVLPGGLRVVTERFDHTAACNLGFFVGVGSREESPALHGASHMLEHVLFKGTPHRSAEQISASIEGVGGDLNAYTSKEHTCFYARLLGDEAARAVEVLGDMLAHSLILPEHFAAERNVVLEEIAMGNDDPSDLANDLVARQVYGSHGLALPVIGSVDSVVAMRRDDVAGYWQERYRSDAIVVSATGQVDHDWLVDQLLDLDTALAAAPATGRPVDPPAISTAPTFAPGVVVHERDFEQLDAVMGWPGMALRDDRRAAVDVLLTVLGGGMSARLFVEVRERRGLAYAIDASEAAYSDAGQVSIEWACTPDRLQEVVDVVGAVVADITDRGITEEELARAKAQIRGQTLLAMESPAAHMSRNGRMWLHQDERTIAEILQDVARVSRDDVLAVARTLFASPPTLAVVGPWEAGTTVRLG